MLQQCQMMLEQQKLEVEEQVAAAETLEEQVAATETRLQNSAHLEQAAATETR